MRYQMVNVDCHWPPASVSAGRVKEAVPFDMCEGPLFESVLAASLAASASGGPQQAAPSPLNPQTSSERKEERGKLGDTRPTGTGDRLSKAIRASDLPSCKAAVLLAEPPGYAPKLKATSTTKLELADPGHDAKVKAAGAARREEASPGHDAKLREASVARREAQASSSLPSRQQAATERTQRFLQVRDEESCPGPTANMLCRICPAKKATGQYARTGCCTSCWKEVLRSRDNN